MTTPVPLLAWVRTPVVPRHGALRHHLPHTLAAPLVTHLLQQTGLPPAAVDALLLGNALGAGGNPARMTVLASGLPQRCMALTVETQCCSGLDAILLAATQILAGQADIVIAGGSEAWSRAPIRQHRPTRTGEAARPYERPPFTPWPACDPDPLQAAAIYAARHGWTRTQQDAYARQSHARALTHPGDGILALQTAPAHKSRAGICAGNDASIHAGASTGTGTSTGTSTSTSTSTGNGNGNGNDDRNTAAAPTIGADTYPRPLSDRQLQRMPVLMAVPPEPAGAKAPEGPDCALSRLAVSPQADGAALVLLASESACHRHGLRPSAWWQAGLALGTDPETPLTGAWEAATALLAREHRAARQLDAVELHDAFAVQGLAFLHALQQQGMDPSRLNAWGGGLARGHPIGASGAIALVQLLARLHHQADVISRTGGTARADTTTQTDTPTRAAGTAPACMETPRTPASHHLRQKPRSHLEPPGRRLGLACIAGAGGLGSAALVSVAGTPPGQRDI